MLSCVYWNIWFNDGHILAYWAILKGLSEHVPRHLLLLRATANIYLTKINKLLVGGVAGYTNDCDARTADSLHMRINVPHAALYIGRII